MSSHQSPPNLSQSRTLGQSGGQYLTPFQRKQLQKRLQEDLSPKYRQRIQIMLLADEGKTQAQICQALNCSPITARHWMLIARSGEAHNWQSHPIGRPKAVNEEYLQRLQELVSQSPRDIGYSFRNWTAQKLSQHLATEFGIEVSDRHINRLLKKMGLSTRPKPPQPDTSPDAEEDSDKRIVISNLTPSHTPETQDVWQFNPIKMS